MPKAKQPTETRDIQTRSLGEKGGGFAPTPETVTEETQEVVTEGDPVE